MPEENSLELEKLLVQKGRRQLIPVWIKIFIWIFIVFGAFIPIIFLIRLSGQPTLLSLYGLETNDAFSNLGIIVSMLFLFKGIAAFSMWTENDWAIKLGLIDAIIGIIICAAFIVAPLFNVQLSYHLRLELIALIPYLIWLLRVKEDWERKSIEKRF